jgi:hypothetical protein
MYKSPKTFAHGLKESRRTFSRNALMCTLGCVPLIGQGGVETKETLTNGEVLTNGKLSPGFDMGVDDNHHLQKWLTEDDDHLILSYPSGLAWGAVFVTRGKPQNNKEDRLIINLSDYKTLIVEMRGGLGGERVEIGIKTNEQPDDGSETKFNTRLTTDWGSYPYPLSRFKYASPSRLYVVTEFVFSGGKAQTVLARTIRYTKE